MATPRFKQGEYEYLIRLIRRRGGPPSRLFIDQLCDILADDNPMFKPDLFKRKLEDDGGIEWTRMRRTSRR